MNQFKIGIRLESLGPTLRQAVREAQRLGVKGVQADATGDLAPQSLSQTGRNAFRSLLRSHNLELTALGCASRRGLDSPEDQQQRVEHTKAVLGLSVDLGARIAIAQAGRIPEHIDDRGALTEILQDLGRHGDHIGAVLALETGLESGAVLAGFLLRFRFDTASLGVNLDPASLLLHGFDPCESARALRGKVVHVRATDARRASLGRSTQEMPLGHGDIDWPHFIGVLDEIDYHGWLTIERNAGGNRVAEVTAGISFLEQFIACPA
jgi:sugar phosphate isomerase/epimerase